MTSLVAPANEQDVKAKVGTSGLFPWLGRSDLPMA